MEEKQLKNELEEADEICRLIQKKVIEEYNEQNETYKYWQKLCPDCTITVTRKKNNGIIF